MSMTREEAVELLCYGDWLNVISEHIGKTDTEKIAEAMSIVGKTLRPVSRKQVEKVWPGCHKCRTCDSCAYRTIKPEEEPCFSCNTDIYSNYKPEPGRMFCSTCGAPMTDEAVDMVVERINEMEGIENGLG